MAVDGALYDAIRVILLLGLALLAFRELRNIRARMKDDKDRKRRDEDRP